MDSARKMSIVRSDFLFSHPFFAHLAMQLHLVEDPNCDMGWTDGITLGYNPKYIDSLSVSATGGLVAEEVMHIANEHPWRGGGRDADDWNRACLALGTRIEMADGTQCPIENITVGEYVASPDGPSRVLGVVFSGLEYVLQIGSSSNMVICTSDHQLLTTVGLINAGSKKYPKGLQALRRRFHGSPRGKRVCSEKLSHHVTDRTQCGHGRSLSECCPIPSTTRPDGRSLYYQELESTRRLKTFANRIGLSRWDNRRRRNACSKTKAQSTALSASNSDLEYFFRSLAMAKIARILRDSFQEWTRQLLFPYILVRFPFGQLAALDSTIFSDQGASRGSAFETYQAAKASIEDRTNDGSYATNCLADDSIEQARLQIGERSRFPRPVFDLITEKSFIFAEGLIVHNCDLSIFPIIRNARFEIPNELFDPVRDAWCVGKSAEYIYSQIHKPKPKNGGGGQGKPQNQPGNGPKQGKQGGNSQDEGKDQDNQDKGQNKPPRGRSEVRRPPPEKVQELKLKWQEAVVTAAQIAKQAGKLPAGIEQLVTAITHPKIDWRNPLRKFMQSFAKNDYSWARPNKKFIPAGLYLPSRYSEALGKIVLFGDTSGSRDYAEARAEFIAEFGAIHAELRPEMTYTAFFDTQVYPGGEFGPDDEIEWRPRGGGGTDVRNALKWVEDQEISPSCVVILTDGYTPFPNSPPDFPVLWCMTTNVQPPWGERIQL